MIDELLAKYPNDVKVVIKNFAIGSHKEAPKAARYALAAHKQGKFKEMYHLIFDNWRQLKSNEDLPLQLAVELGLDVNQLAYDVDSDEIKNQYSLEGQEFRSLGDLGMRLAVPKFLINGWEPPGKRSVKSFSDFIEKELKK